MNMFQSVSIPMLIFTAAACAFDDLDTATAERWNDPDTPFLRWEDDLSFPWEGKEETEPGDIKNGKKKPAVKGETGDEDPELAELLKKLDGDLTEKEANILRGELYRYWLTRYGRAYRELLAYYEKRSGRFPEQLRTAEMSWRLCVATTVESQKYCLREGFKEPTSGWYRTNIFCLMCSMVEERCRMLENLLETIKENKL